MEIINNTMAGMNLSPIQDYNKYLKENKSFDVDSSTDFENVLNQKSAELQNPLKVQGSISMNKFDDVVAQNSVQSINPESTDALIKSFGSSVNGGLNSVNNALNAANEAQEAMATGKDVSVHDVMIAAEKASLSLQMTMQLRNKLMSAYTEINSIKV